MECPCHPYTESTDSLTSTCESQLADTLPTCANDMTVRQSQEESSRIPTGVVGTLVATHIIVVPKVRPATFLVLKLKLANLLGYFSISHFI